MIKKMTILMLLGLIISFSSNDDDNQITCELIKSVTNKIGTIGTKNVDGIEKSTINTAVTETIDSVITGINDDLPSEFYTVGTEVIYSNTYTKGENKPSSILKEQIIYNLTLSSIEINKTFKINGEFRHTISDCNNTDNPEINCVEFIEFINETEVNVLVNGNDILNIAIYEIVDDKINIEIIEGLNINISFLIQDEMTLKRIGSDDIWTKVE